MSVTDPSGAGHKRGLPPRPKSLVRLWTIAVIALVLVVALVLLFPGRAYLRLGQQGQYDKASVGYLQTLLRVEPHNDALRLALAEQLIARGSLPEAQKVLSGLASPGVSRAELARLRLDMAQYAALRPGSSEREQARQRVRVTMVALHALPADKLTDVQILHVVDGALAFGLPADAALWYQALAMRHPRSNYSWWALAGRWWLAAGKPGQAAKAWQQALRSAGDEQQRHQAAQQALAAARMHGAEQALQVARKLLALDPSDPQLLAAAIDAAQAANAPRQALTWARMLAALHPHDDAARRRLAQVAVGMGDLATALEAYQVLAQHYPQDAAIQSQLAKLYIWTGQPARALPYFRTQASLHPSASLDQQLLKLALAAHDYPTVVAAMLRQSKRRHLSTAEMTDLVKYMDDQLGQPRRAARLLKGWLSGKPGERPLWQRLATIQVRTGERAQAMATWRHVMQLYGRDLTAVTTLAQLQVEQWNLAGALKTLASLLGPEQTAPDDPAYWQALGDVARQQANTPMIARAYGWLLQHHPDDLHAVDADRLVSAWLHMGKPERAVDVLAATWPRTPNAAVLMEVLGGLLDQGRLDLVDRVLAIARRDPALFRSRAQYWELLARVALLRHDPDTARADFLAALRIDPHSPGAKAGLLSVLMDQRKMVELEHYLALWHAEAWHDPALWEIYALAYSRLGQPRQALPWFSRRMQARPGDYLWLLSYADALDAARRFADGYRMRLHALLKLRPKLLRDMGKNELARTRHEAARILPAQLTLLGGAENLAWLQRVLTTRDVTQLSQVDLELLVNWHLAEHEPEYARYWLLRARMRKLRMPAYQRLSVALAQNDVPAIRDLLAHSVQPGVVDRVAGLRRTGKDADALLLALNHINASQPWSAGIDSLPRYAAELYQRMPQYAGIDVSSTRTGDLSMTSQEASLVRSSEDWSLAAHLRNTRLRQRGGNPAPGATGREHALSVRLTHRTRRSASSLLLGRVDGQGGSGFNQISFDTGYQWTRRLHAGAFVHRHQQSLDSGPFRRLGMRNAWGINLDYAATARDSLSMTAQRLDYRSHRDAELGSGYQFDASLNHNLAVGQTWQLAAYANASYVNNDLAAILPAWVAARLPPGSGTDALLSDRFGYTGVGMRLARGQPGSAYPLVGGLRFSVDAGVGYVWPDRRPGFHFSGALGSRVFGSDELSLSLRFDQTRTQVRGNSLGIGLRYRYFFGK